MPRTKRAPIDYTPQFGAGIFRPKEAVEEELAALGELDAAEPIETGAGRPAAAAQPRQTADAVRPKQRTNVRTNERMRVRHSFDIYQDQLLALTEIQTDLFTRTGRKPKLGELVQEALDTYIAKQQKRTNVRTNEQSYERRQE